MSRAKRRYYRTIVLGIAAMATLIWAAVDQFGIPWSEMRQLFYLTLAVVAITIVCGGVTAWVWIGLRKLLRKYP